MRVREPPLGNFTCVDALGNSLDERVAFGRFVLDPARRVLLRDGKPVALHAKAFALLSILVAERGAAISREALYKALWPDGFVEDGNLTQNIYLLRRTLDPSGDGRRFIGTLPRHGYRFAMPVTQSAGGAAQRRWFAAPAYAIIAASIVALFVSGSSGRTTAVELTPSASLAYTLGLYHFNRRTPAELRMSAGYFRQAIRDAPQSPLGYAGLASAYAIDADDEKDGSRLSKYYVAQARRLRDEALQRDGANPEAHTVSGFLAYRYDKNNALAEREFQFVFASEPNNATAHHWHAVMKFAQGAIHEALGEWELAHQLEPTSEVISRWLGRAYFYDRRNDDAIRTLDETLAIEPGDHEAWLQLASAQELRGNLQAALKSLERVRRTIPQKETYIRGQEERVHVIARHEPLDAHEIAQIGRLVATNVMSASDAALLYTALGDRSRAIAMLRKVHRMGMDFSMTKFDPRFDPLRSDPRFQKIFD